MEPERRDTHTYVERDRETRSGGGKAMSFIVGGLVVAVAILALVFWSGDFGGGRGDVDVVGISTQDPAPVAVPVENNVEINTEAPDAAVEIEDAPEPAETLPMVPAQN